VIGQAVELLVGHLVQGGIDHAVPILLGTSTIGSGVP
jgi:hypothetical protein